MTIVAPLKSAVKSIWKTLLPHHYWQNRFQALTDADHEVELRLVPYLCDAAKISVDVGASAGIFSVRMCRASREVIAFEPRPRQARELRAMFASVGLPLRVEEAALSNEAGTAQLRMLVEDLGRSTIEPANSLEDEDGSPKAQVTVNVRKLDDYALKDVAFIKVDVEGHEVAVLEGATETIGRCQPVLLIESEDRHRKNAVADVNSTLRKLGYSGFFLHDGRICPLDEFSPATHQDPRNIGGWKSHWARRGVYVNNFFFLPAERKAQLADAIRMTNVPG